MTEPPKTVRAILLAAALCGCAPAPVAEPALAAPAVTLTPANAAAPTATLTAGPTAAPAATLTAEQAATCAPIASAAPAAAPPSGSATTCLEAFAAHQRKLQAQLDAARGRMAARDGAGCLAALGAYDRIEPRVGEPSTSAQSPWAMTRAMCTMLAGQCSAGKELYRATLVHNAGAALGPDQLARSVDAIAGMYCEGNNLADRDKIVRASQALVQAGYVEKRSPAFCQEHIRTLKDLLPRVPPKSDDDREVRDAPDALRGSGGACLVKADDCAGAWAFYEDIVRRVDLYRYARPDRRDLAVRGAQMSPSAARQAFDATYPGCRKAP